jgi:hypothetical protein
MNLETVQVTLLPPFYQMTVFFETLIILYISILLVLMFGQMKSNWNLGYVLSGPVSHIASSLMQ